MPLWHLNDFTDWQKLIIFGGYLYVSIYDSFEASANKGLRDGKLCENIDF